MSGQSGGRAGAGQVWRKAVSAGKAGAKPLRIRGLVKQIAAELLLALQADPVRRPPPSNLPNLPNDPKPFLNRLVAQEFKVEFDAPTLAVTMIASAEVRPAPRRQHQSWLGSARVAGAAGGAGGRSGSGRGGRCRRRSTTRSLPRLARPQPRVRSHCRFSKKVPIILVNLV